MADDVLLYTSDMSWAARRKFFILFTIGGVVAAFVAIVFIVTLYKAPSCADSTQNQGEVGIDCGGPCPYLCVANEQPPTVLFTQSFTDTTTGRTAVVASVENKNMTAAAKNVPYRMTLYGANQTLIQSVSGTLDLPPGAKTTVFIPSITSGKQRVTNSFLDIDAASVKWVAMTSDPRVVPGVSNTVQGGTVDTPRVDATLVNGTPKALTNVRVVVLVRDAHLNVIAISGTVLPTIPAQGSAVATFTWNVPFNGTPASIEVDPIIPLPDQQAGLP